MRLKILNDRVLIKPDPDDFYDRNPEISRILKEGTIVLPDIYEGSIKKVAQRGEIVLWGDKCKYKYEVGDMVLYGRFSGIIHMIDGVKHLLLNEEDLHAKEEHD